MSFKILTSTSAIKDGEIVHFYPCSIAGRVFLYCEQSACEAADHAADILRSAGTDLRTVCKTCSMPIPATKKKGTKFCSDYCRIRHKRISERIERGESKEDTFFAGYYDILRKEDTYTVSLRHKKVSKYRLKNHIEEGECVWMPKYAPLEIDGKAAFLVCLEEKCDQAVTAFLKIVLESGTWK